MNDIISILSVTALPDFVSDIFRTDFGYVVGTDVRDPQKLRARTHGHDVVLTSVDAPLRATHIAALAPSVRAIATYSMGLDHIDLDAARARSLAVFNTPDVLTDSVAEVAMFHLLAVLRRATESISLVRSGSWPGWSPGQLLGGEACGKSLGIFGLGRIGRAVAQRARAFGMIVHYCNRNRLPMQLEANAIYHQTFASLLGASDLLLLAAPSGPATKGLLDAEHIQRMKRGACVVNIARGDLIDDDALIDALRTGHLGGAGLDVFNHEPRFDTRYLELPNVFLTPHIGSSTIEARRRMAQLLSEGLSNWRRGVAANNRVA
jgi:lactate dehydrogenase-like 2-hydroxyacid dehydrogenase